MHCESNRRNKSKVIAVDFFCGAGGLTRGLLDVGIEVRLGIDIDERFRETYNRNNNPANFFQIDIQRLRGSALEQMLDVKPDEKLLLTACAPCQPFSSHNWNHQYDRRKSLLLQVGRVLTELKRKPDFLFLENVPAINDVGQRVIKSFQDVLRDLRYNYTSGVIDAKDYGVPQQRKRFILIGVKKSLCHTPISFPKKTHGYGGNGLLPYCTVKDTIGHFPKLTAGRKHESVINHECAGLSPINLKRLAHSRPGGTRLDWPKDLILNCHKKHRGHSDVYQRMRWDKPSPTLTCRCTSISNGRFGHPSQLRAISIREAAALQTFPNNYEFFGDFGSKAMQVGNAVPVKLAEVFGEHLSSLNQNR